MVSAAWTVGTGAFFFARGRCCERNDFLKSVRFFFFAMEPKVARTTSREGRFFKSVDSCRFFPRQEPQGSWLEIVTSKDFIDNGETNLGHTGSQMARSCSQLRKLCNVAFSGMERAWCIKAL